MFSKAAKELGINYSTAKSIIQVYKMEGRANRIPHKKRNRDQILENLPSESTDNPILEKTDGIAVRRSTRTSKPMKVSYREDDEGELEEEEFLFAENSLSEGSSLQVKTRKRVHKESNCQKKSNVCRIRYLDNIKVEEVKEETLEQQDTKLESEPEPEPEASQNNDTNDTENASKEFLPRIEKDEQPLKPSLHSESAMQPTFVGLNPLIYPMLQLPIFPIDLGFFMGYRNLLAKIANSQ